MTKARLCPMSRGHAARTPTGGALRLRTRLLARSLFENTSMPPIRKFLTQALNY